MVLMRFSSVRPRNVEAFLRTAVGLLCVAFLIPLAALAALSGGGTTIASAPTITPGQRVFGNTASEPVVDVGVPCVLYSGQWWLLDLRAGDRVEVIWENPAPAEHFSICVFGAGGTDARPGRLVMRSTRVHPPHSGGATFLAAATWAHPLFIGHIGFINPRSGDPGPYSILTSVLHRALVYVPRLLRVTLRGKLVADIRTPEGEPVTASGLQLRLVGIWKDKPHLPPSKHVLAAASPSSGVAVFPYTLPRKLAGRVIGLRVVGGGATLTLTGRRHFRPLVRIGVGLRQIRQLHDEEGKVAAVPRPTPRRDH